MKFFLVCLSVLVLGASLSPAATADESAKAVVDSFYKGYIAAVNRYFEDPQAKGGQDGSAYVKAHDGLFTKGFLQSYRKLIKDPELGFDPILQSNDVPDAIEVREVRVRGDVAAITARYVGYADSTPPLKIRLKLTEGTWRIDAIGETNK